MLEIREVPEFDQAREQIYRLRYDVFVSEMGFSLKYVDDVLQTVYEPCDGVGRVYAAFAEGDVVGTVRTDYACVSDLDDYFKLRGINPAEFENAVVTSKLAVAADFRGGSVALRLGAATYADCLRDGIRFGFLDCDRSLVPFYERKGYRVFGKVEYEYPEVGEAVVMVMDLHDEEHLRRVRSPLLKAYLAWQEEEEAAAPV